MCNTVIIGILIKRYRGINSCKLEETTESIHIDEYLPSEQKNKQSIRTYMNIYVHIYLHVYVCINIKIQYIIRILEVPNDVN